MCHFKSQLELVKIGARHIDCGSAFLILENRKGLVKDLCNLNVAFFYLVIASDPALSRKERGSVAISFFDKSVRDCSVQMNEVRRLS